MSMNTEKHKERLIARLRDKEHRDAFVLAQIQVGIPFQIRALREQKGWTQKELADHAGKKQAWIAQIENPNYSGFSLKTLLKIASVFDVGLIVRFAPISALVKWELELSAESLKVQSFEEDRYFKPLVTSIENLKDLTLPSKQPRTHDQAFVAEPYPGILPQKKRLLTYSEQPKTPGPESYTNLYENGMSMAPQKERMGATQ